MLLNGIGNGGFRKRQKTMYKDKVSYAVVGLGHIEQAAVLPAFEHAGENSELTAFITSDAA
jgi:hypothetical protein